MRSAPYPCAMRGALSRVRLFEGMSEDVLWTFESELSRFDFEPGQFVIREGDLSRDMYVVLSGALTVYKFDEDGDLIPIAELGEGDCFGEMAVLDVMPRSASVRAERRTTVLRISSADLHDQLFVPHPKDHALLMMNLAKELSRRLRAIGADRMQLRKVFGFVDEEVL